MIAVVRVGKWSEARSLSHTSNTRLGLSYTSNRRLGFSYTSNPFLATCLSGSLSASVLSILCEQATGSMPLLLGLF